ncbi:MAG: hypothetical protein D3903_19955 [Candidatus Electrothrix sp. GM3_4]|nr:hypothetical protein [Candidatus Electrothrix sp. GM3_4]
MNYLTHDQILRIHSEALKIHLQRKRSCLLSGMATAYTASLPVQPDPSSQLLSDLTNMNSVEVIIGDVVPIERWLLNAAYISSVYPSKQRFFRELSDNVASKYKSISPEEESVTDNDLTTIHERVVVVNDMIPVGFLEGASRTAASVARMIVPRFENGVAASGQFSSSQISYYGTGWLIGSQYVITNHHVVNARNPGETDASDVDFKMQGESATVHFDYDFEGTQGTKKRSQALL